jgi:hypothetical protein
MLPKGFEKVRADRYLSLVNVRAFISAALKGDRKAMAKLYSKVVWAESFGIPANISTIKGVDLQKMKKHDRQKRRVFR